MALIKLNKNTTLHKRRFKNNIGITIIHDEKMGVVKIVNKAMGSGQSYITPISLNRTTKRKIIYRKPKN